MPGPAALFGRSCSAAVIALFAAASPSYPLAGPAPDVRRDAVVEAVEKVLPSVVNIGTKTRLERRGWYYDWWRDNWAPFSQELPPRESAGSGVVIDEAGYILTNVHVVEGATEIWVSLPADSPTNDARENPREGAPRVLQADLVSFSPTRDIALLKLRKPGLKLKAAKFAKDDDLLLGETVLALGNPFGLGGSVSRGILSSKSRRAEVEEEERLQLRDWLQTDASINPGNSGGPLINLRGEVLGINVAILREGQGIGFAIPIKRVSEALAEIYTPEELKQLWFGARIKAGHLPLRVSLVQPDSPADQAGLRVGDLIAEINGQVPRSFIDFEDELIAAGETKSVSLTVRRDDGLKELSVRLRPETAFFNAELIRQKIGATLQELDADLAESMGLRRSDGLIVAGVERGGPAADAGLQRGAVVRAIDGQPVNELVAAAKRLHARPKGERATLEVLIQRVSGPFVRRATREIEIKVR
jgi:S1-C subfamily serine protease